jgi:hypothetical protein
LFSQYNFEQSSCYNTPKIQRHHICEHHLHRCNDVKKYMQNLFVQWDYILSLFPSYAALEQWDKRFNPRTQDGGIFYRKLSIFQAWYNLHSEINRLIMTCTQCHMWPYETSSSVGKPNDNISRPPTPSSSSSSEQRDFTAESPPRSGSFVTSMEAKTRRQNTLASMSSIDSIYQLPLTPAAALPEYYYR